MLDLNPLLKDPLINIKAVEDTAELWSKSSETRPYVLTSPPAVRNAVELLYLGCELVVILALLHGAGADD